MVNEILTARFDLGLSLGLVEFFIQPGSGRLWGKFFRLGLTKPDTVLFGHCFGRKLGGGFARLV
jgi:hypothetical protein